MGENETGVYKNVTDTWIESEWQLMSICLENGLFVLNMLMRNSLSTETYLFFSKVSEPKSFPRLQILYINIKW